MYYLFEYFNRNPSSRKQVRIIQLFHAQLDLLSDDELHAVYEINFYPGLFTSIKRKRLLQILKDSLRKEVIAPSIFSSGRESQMNELLLQLPIDKCKNHSIKEITSCIKSIKGQSEEKLKEACICCLKSMPFPERKLFCALITGSFNSSEAEALFRKWISKKYNLSIASINFHCSSHIHIAPYTDWKILINSIANEAKDLFPKCLVKSERLPDLSSFKFVFEINQPLNLLEIVVYGQKLAIWNMERNLEFELHSFFLQNLHTLKGPSTLINFDTVNKEILFFSDTQIQQTKAGKYELRIASNISDSLSTLDYSDKQLLATNDHMSFALKSSIPRSFDFPILYVKGRYSVDSIVLGICKENTLVPFCEIDGSQIPTQFIQKILDIAEKHTVDSFGPVRMLAPKYSMNCMFSGIKSNKRKKSGIEAVNPKLTEEPKPHDDSQIPKLEELIDLF